MQQYVVAVGNSFDGVTLYGPYTREEVNELDLEKEFKNHVWHIVKLHDID